VLAMTRPPTGRDAGERSKVIDGDGVGRGVAVSVRPSPRRGAIIRASSQRRSRDARPVSAECPAA
jgi:hypothetical protein